MITSKQLFFVGDRVKAKNDNITDSTYRAIKGDIGTIRSIDIQNHEFSGIVITDWDNGKTTENSCALIFTNDYLEKVHSTESKSRLDLIDMDE